MQVLQVQLEVGADPAEVGRARKWVRSLLVHSGIAADEPVAETLALIVSELVTNAVVHTGCPAVLRLLLEGCAQDAARDVPADRAAPPAAAAPREHGQDGAARAAAEAHGCPADRLADARRAARTPRVEIDTVRVEVADASARPPRPRQADDDETHGRGLALVDGLADRWGWEQAGSGKRIWCELDRDTPVPAPASRRSRPACAAYGTVTAYEAV